MKIQVKNKGSELKILYKLEDYEEFNPFEVDIFSKKLMFGMMRITEIHEKKKRIQYTVPQSIPLANYIKSGLDTQRFFLVVAQLLEIIKTCGANRLQTNNLVLNADYIFVSPASAELMFMYRPVRSQFGTVNYFDFFKSVVFSTAFFDPRSSDSFPKFTTFLKTMPMFSASEIEKYIKGVCPSVYQRLPKNNGPGSGFMAQNRMEYNQHYAQKNPASVQAGPPPQQFRPQAGPPPQPFQPQPAPLPQQFRPQAGPPPQQFRPQAGPPPQQFQTQPPPPPQQFAPNQQQAMPKKPQEIFYGAGRPSAPPQPVFEATTLLEDNSDSTTVLGDYSEATTVLSEDGKAPVIKFPFLVRVSNGEKVFVNKPVFRIGKEKSYVDYFVSDNSAVSRSHADIITKGKQYFIYDNNSTNKTYVNDEVILVHREVEIHNGTRIRLGNEEFEFHIEN